MYDQDFHGEHDGFAGEPDDQPLDADAYTQLSDAELAHASATAIAWPADPMRELLAEQLRAAGISVRCPQPDRLDIVE